MATQSKQADLGAAAARQRMPAGVRWAVLGTVGLICAGALYLIAVRGEALLLDLSALGRILCL